MRLKNYPLHGLRCLLTVAIAALLHTGAYASHLVGTDLYYKHINLDTYKVFVVLYGDCGPMSAGAFATLPTSAPAVCVYDGSTLVSSINLAIDTGSGVEITPLCPGDTSQCTNPSSTIPGVKRYRYSAVYVVPHTSAVWRFVYKGYNSVSGASAGRAAAITNITTAGSTVIELEDTLNNTVYNNSSAYLTVAQQTFFCNTQHDEYDPGVTDPDGDSVVISLVSVKNGSGSTGCGASGTAPTYTGSAWSGMPISAVEPLQVLTDSFKIDSSTGKLIFHPSAFQRAVLVYNLREYRSGAFIASSQREMTVLVLDCVAAFPCLLTGTTATKIIENEKIEIYPNPANDQLSIRTTGQFNTVIITNTLGQVLIQQQLLSSKNELNISLLPSGVYYVTLKGEKGSSVRKFVKE